MKRNVLLLLVVTAASSLPAAGDPASLAAARALFADRGKSSEAQAAFEKIAAAEPSSAEAQDFLARLALRRNDVDRAVTHAEQAVALAPDNADCQHTLGEAYGTSAEQAGMFGKISLGKKCLAAFERAAALAPGNVDFHQSLFDIYRMAPAMLGGGPEKAAAEAAKIKALDHARGRLAYAALYAADKRYDLALAEFDELLKTSPDDYATLYQVGRLAATTGQFLDRGLSSLRRCLELTPPSTPSTPGHAAAQWRIGNILEKKNDTPGARAAYEASLKIDPNFKQAAEALKKLK